MENFSIAEEALATSSDSAGSALEENEKYLDSVQGKIDVMKASFETLASDVMQSDFLKGVLEALTAILDVIDKIIDSVGTLPTLVGAIATVLSAKNIGRDKMSSLLQNMPISMRVLSDTIVFT